MRTYRVRQGIVAVVGLLAFPYSTFAQTTTSTDAAIAELRQLLAEQRAALDRQARTIDEQGRTLAALQRQVESPNRSTETAGAVAAQASAPQGPATRTAAVPTPDLPTEVVTAGDFPGSIDGQPFDTVAGQIARNGDTGKALLVKIDVEGAEWESLLATPDAVLDTFVQLPMELHLRGAPDESRFLALIRRLKDKFDLVNLHFNNYPLACTNADEPLPARAFQALWVNKRIGILDPDAPSPTPPSPLNAADDPNSPECPSRTR